MRTKLTILTSGAVLVLLGGPAAALSPETTCESIKLHAAGSYARCVARAVRLANARARELSDEDVAACDARFDHAIASAEAGGPCRTAGGPATLRNPLRWQMEDTLAAVTSAGGCPTAITHDETAQTYTCTLELTGDARWAIDLEEIVEQIGSSDVSTSSVIWIEGCGGNGNTSNGGSSGPPGYAQMTTSPADLESEFSSTTVYYYNGNKGSSNANEGGGAGGAATMVAMYDLTQSAPELDQTLIIAPGGGGGGGGRGEANKCKKEAYGGAGGEGGAAISVVGSNKFGRGADGGGRRNQTNYGGGGGGNADGTGGTLGGGPTAQPGDDGIAPLGGNGTTFTNISNPQVSASGGQGGQPGADAGGGDGGGGYGAGGGGEEANDHNDCASGGGGGGGAFARASTQSCARSRPSQLSGVVQIVFDAGRCSSGPDDGTPVVTAVSPSTVTVGATFKISGNTFTDATAVLIGNQQLATSAWSFISDSEIDVSAPSDPVAFGTPLAVQVENAKGKSGSSQNVTINAGVPTVVSVSMSPVTVGETFTINGTNFIDPTAVQIAGSPIDASLWTLESGSAINVTAPAVPGLYGDALAVEVQTKYGDSNSNVNVVINQQ